MSNSTAEQRIPQNLSWQRYLLYILGTVLLVASLYARARLFPIVSVDYTASLSHWMDALHGNSGLTAFKYPFSDYAPLYLYFLKFLTLLPFNYLYSIKGLTLLFDSALGIAAAFIVKKREPHFSTPVLFVVGALVFSIPTVILNGAAWAQVDSAYTLFVLISLYYILKDKPLAATIAFSIAFCFKLQAVFFLPILVGYLLSRIKKLWYLILIPIIFALTIVPAWLGSGTFGTWFTIYFHQTQEAPLLTRSAPSVFSFFNQNNLSVENHPVAPLVGIILATIVALLIALVTAWFNHTLSQRKKSLVMISLISVIAIPFFLPYMHERYFYIADVLSIILAFYEPYLFFIPIAVIAASFYSYLPFLSATVPQVGKYIVNEGYPGASMLFALVVLTIWFIIWQLRMKAHHN